MVPKIRKDNTFKHNWAIRWNGDPEDFSDATDINLTAIVIGQYKKLERGTHYRIDGNIIKIDCTPSICNRTGVYKLELKYKKPNSDFIDGQRRSAVDLNAFEIVPDSAQANVTQDISTTSDAIVGFNGKDSFQVWKETHEGDISNYEAWLRQPAMDAAKEVTEAVGQFLTEKVTEISDVLSPIQEAETARVNAEGDATNGRVKAENERVAAEEARVNAEGDATKGRVKAENDRVKAEQAREAAEEGRAAELATKANHGYDEDETPKSVKELDTEIGQLAGDVKSLSSMLIANNRTIEIISATSVKVNHFRYAFSDGVLKDYVLEETFSLPSQYSYLLATATSSGITISVGVKAYAWSELPTLQKDQFILLYKNASRFGSDNAIIQDIIDRYYLVENPILKKEIGFGQIVGGTIEIISATSVKVNHLRYAFSNGVFKDYVLEETFSLPSQYSYLLATATSSGITISVGVKAYAWSELPTLQKDQFILLYKNAHRYYSDYPWIQEEISRMLYGQKTPTIRNKTLKANGTPGVDCDYNDLKTALDDLGGATWYNQNRLYVLNGIYDLSDDGNNYMGIRNYLEIIGESRKGVQIIKRDSTYSVSKAAFDALGYPGESIKYAKFKNLTVITDNCKAPFHIDAGSNIAPYAKIIIEDCDLINEITETTNVGNCFAAGISNTQTFELINVYANGMLWAHNNSGLNPNNGCTFRLINCNCDSIAVGDVTSYNNDICEVRGCRANRLNFNFYKDYPTASDGHYRDYIVPSFTFIIDGNRIDRVVATVVYDNNGPIINEDAMDVLYGGKWSITDSNIHSYRQNTSAITIQKGSLISYNSEMSIVAWENGKRFSGVALEEIIPGGMGVVQDNGCVILQADATEPISYGDDVELNSSGIAVKHSTGNIIGMASMDLPTGTGELLVKIHRI